MEKIAFKDGERLSHAYIVASPSEEAGSRMAKELACALLCSSAGAVPCGTCRDCRKASQGIHPDLITICRETDDKGNKKREIYVDQIRYMTADAYVLPNEARRKVYVVEEADAMNASAQNAALKLLEEPPAAAAFILRVKSPEALLPTVRSRCVLLRHNDEGERPSDESLSLAREFIKTAAGGSFSQMLSWCAKNESMEVKTAREFTQSVSGELIDMLCLRVKNPGLSRKKIMELIELMNKCREYLGTNTAVKHIMGLISVSAVSDRKDNT